MAKVKFVKVRLLVKVKIPILLLLISLPGLLWSQIEEHKMCLSVPDTSVYQARVFIKGERLLWSGDLKMDSIDGLGFGNTIPNVPGRYHWWSNNELHEFSIDHSDLQKFEEDLRLINRSIGSKPLIISNHYLSGSLSSTSRQGLGDTLMQNNSAGKPFREYFNAKHSKTWVVGIDGRTPEVSVFFAGIDSSDVPVFQVLSKIIGQRNSTFSQNMIGSGLNIEATLVFNAVNARDYVRFELQPNPFGVKEAIEAFFVQLYRMPQFDYTTKAQLDLAKEQLAIDYEFAMDRFETQATYAAGFWASGNLELMPSFMDSIESVTKVDIMNFIRKYLQTQPFLIAAQVPHSKKEETLIYLRETKNIEEYLISFSGEKDARLNKEQVLKLQEVSYLLDLTSWAKVEVHVYGRKKRVRERRAKAVLGYFGSKDHDNVFNVLYHKGKLEEHNEVVTFSIGSNE